MATVCPKCKREFLSQRDICPVCGCTISNGAYDNLPHPQDSEKFSAKSTRPMTATPQKKKTGIFSSVHKNTASSVYKKMTKYLKPKDGMTHVIMINSFSKWLNQNFECENKYTTQIDEIVSSMQDDGYEIIDIKFNSLMNQGLMGQMEGFHTLIIYR